MLIYVVTLISYILIEKQFSMYKILLTNIVQKSYKRLIQLKFT